MILYHPAHSGDLITPCLCMYVCTGLCLSVCQCPLFSTSHNELRRERYHNGPHGLIITYVRCVSSFVNLPIGQPFCGAISYYNLEMSIPLYTLDDITCYYYNIPDGSTRHISHLISIGLLFWTAGRLAVLTVTM